MEKKKFLTNRRKLCFRPFSFRKHCEQFSYLEAETSDGTHEGHISSSTGIENIVLIGPLKIRLALIYILHILVLLFPSWKKSC